MVVSWATQFLLFEIHQKKTMYWALPFAVYFILTCCFLTRELCINHYFVLYLLLEILHVLQYVCICNYITSLNRSLEITFRKKSIILQEKVKLSLPFCTAVHISDLQYVQYGTKVCSRTSMIY